MCVLADFLVGTRIGICHARETCPKKNAARGRGIEQAPERVATDALIRSATLSPFYYIL